MCNPRPSLRIRCSTFMRSGLCPGVHFSASTSCLSQPSSHTAQSPGQLNHQRFLDRVGGVTPAPNFDQVRTEWPSKLMLSNDHLQDYDLVISWCGSTVPHQSHGAVCGACCCPMNTRVIIDECTDCPSFDLEGEPLWICQGQHPGDPMARLPQGCHMAVLGPELSAWTTPAPALLKAILHQGGDGSYQLASYSLPTYKLPI